MRIKPTIAAAIAIAAALGPPVAANAADIKVISSVAMQSVMQDLGPEFERTTSHKLALTFGSAAPLKRQVEAGETFDVVILTPGMIDDLARQGRIAAGTKTDVARAGLGAAIRAGTSRPDIRTPEALKRSLLDAKSIIYSKEGQSGAHMTAVIERLGIAAELKPRTILETRPGYSAAAVAEGKADLGFALISEILPVSGAEFVGPLPAEMQNYIVFTAGISPGAGNAEAASAFVRFLTAPANLPRLKARGLEPGKVE